MCSAMIGRGWSDSTTRGVKKIIITPPAPSESTPLFPPSLIGEQQDTPPLPLVVSSQSQIARHFSPGPTIQTRFGDPLPFFRPALVPARQPTTAPFAPSLSRNLFTRALGKHPHTSCSGLGDQEFFL